MPLRDHFRPPVDDFASWDVLHGGWPMVIVQQLRSRLPEGYVAGPQVHLGFPVEIDVAAFEGDGTPPWSQKLEGNGGGATTAVWAPAKPNVAVQADLHGYDEYEVQVYDVRRGRRLLAAVEIVSPANKDRPESRNAFIGKCAALLQKGVAVSIVDLVTLAKFNLYADLLAFVGQSDPTLGDPPPGIYAATCRWVKREKLYLLEAWSHALEVGQPLPILPLWLTADRYVPLELERTYEQACHDLWIA